MFSFPPPFCHERTSDLTDIHILFRLVSLYFVIGLACKSLSVLLTSLTTPREG